MAKRDKAGDSEVLGSPDVPGSIRGPAKGIDDSQTCENGGSNFTAAPLSLLYTRETLSELRESRDRLRRQCISSTWSGVAYFRLPRPLAGVSFTTFRERRNSEQEC